MSYNPNGGDELKLFTVFRKDVWELVFHELEWYASEKYKNDKLPVCNKENSLRLHLNNDKK